jgi:hypothetical protein
MVVVLSLSLQSAMGSWAAAFFLTVMLLPGILLVKYFAKDLSFKERGKGLLNGFYFLFAVALAEHLCILLTHWILYGANSPGRTNPLLNPVFICFVLASLLSIERQLKTRFFTPSGREEKFITFTSERVRVSIEADSILYIESNDDQVFVRALADKVYPTRMKISQWEAVLDDRFLRVHQAFIVNRDHIARFDSKAVWIGDRPIDISRGYRERVRHRLG